jgi:intron-binding protein aquarius
MPPRKGRKVAAAADVPPKPSEGAAASGRKRKAGGPKNAQKKGRTSGGAHPTVNEIQNDPLTALANENWAPGVAKGKKFDAALVETIYTDEIAPGKVSRLTLLEFSCYLEGYLWPNFDDKASSDAHVLSIIAMVGEKFREGVEVWGCFHDDQAKFPSFFERVLQLRMRGMSSLPLLTMHTVFLIRCFASLEDSMVRAACMRLVSLDCWLSLSEGLLALELKRVPKAKRYTEYLRKKKGEGAEKSTAATFMPTLLNEFASQLTAAESAEVVDRDTSRYLERFLELLVDLLAQLPTRRFFLVVYNNSLVQAKLELSPLTSGADGSLIGQLVKTLRFYVDFEINEHTGSQLDEAAVAALHGSKLGRLQRAAFKHFPELRELALSNHATIESRKALQAALYPLSSERLRELCAHLSSYGGASESDAVLKESLIQYFEARKSHMELLREMPMYPTEAIMWDESVVPSSRYTGDSCLALPKLNLQFLTFPDYLFRNYNLYRLEACYEIREHLMDVIKHVKPRKRRVTYESSATPTIFTGWARMAVSIGNFQVTKVTKPNIGDNHPALVLAEVEYSVRGMRHDVREEWESIRKHDVLYLLTIRSPVEEGTRLEMDKDKSFCEQVGLVYARGVEVDEVLDEQGKIIPEWESRTIRGDDRKLRLLLDSQQYQLDTARMVRQGAEDVYETFNLLVRRKSKENNFKSVLNCIRDIMSKKVHMPGWLQEAFLGYGDPKAAHWRNLEDSVDTLDFKDTFLSAAHLKNCFPKSRLVFSDKSTEPPFRLTFSEESGQELITATSYSLPNMGPYPRNVPKKNPILFTPTQTEAIRSGLNHGLTMVVGPPGTGKTDVAVQIISNLYHSFPSQRTLIITHANSALNDIFEKIMVRDIDERYLLRLGHGAKDLDTESNFMVRGRVDYMLQRRLMRLEEVTKLGKSLKMDGDVGYTCETAAHFKLYHVDSRWKQFISLLRNPQESVSEEQRSIAELFPFTDFFSDAPQPLFGSDHESDLEVSCCTDVQRRVCSKD